MKNMAQTILLSCESISKSYGMKPLFLDLSFALFDGDHVGLVGPNGAGKTTLLRMITGIFYPDQGEILFNGRPFNPRTDIHAIGRGTGGVHRSL